MSNLIGLNGIRFLIFLLFFLFPFFVKAEVSPIVVLTSFSEPVFLKFKEGFESLYPDLELKFVNKKTAAALDHIDRDLKPKPDLFMASSVDAFYWLKKKNHILEYSKSSRPYLFYVPFAFSGYGIMYNVDYLDENAISPPTDWKDLLMPQWQGHIGMTSPTRSGTTHVVVESILQEYGWNNGWSYLIELAGNLATITARSFGVQQGILKKRFGAGPTIDNFAFIEMTSEHKVGFVYPHNPVVLPVNIAIVRGSKNSNNARVFIDYLLSDTGQKLLLDSSIRRFPLNSDLVEEKSGGVLQYYHNSLNHIANYDAALSQERYEMVNLLFDQVITRRLLDLKIFWRHYHELKSNAQVKNSPDALELINQAKKSITKVPFSLDRAISEKIDFQQYHSGLDVPIEQKNIQKEWRFKVQKDYSQAMAYLVKAAKTSGVSFKNIHKGGG